MHSAYVVPLAQPRHGGGALACRALGCTWPKLLWRCMQLPFTGMWAYKCWGCGWQAHECALYMYVQASQA
jgi:hypothetical protein